MLGCKNATLRIVSSGITSARKEEPTTHRPILHSCLTSLLTSEVQSGPRNEVGNGCATRVYSLSVDGNWQPVSTCRRVTPAKVTKNVRGWSNVVMSVVFRISAAHPASRVQRGVPAESARARDLGSSRHRAAQERLRPSGALWAGRRRARQDYRSRVAARRARLARWCTRPVEQLDRAPFHPDGRRGRRESLPPERVTQALA